VDAFILRMGHGLAVGYLFFYIVHLVYPKREDDESCSVTSPTPLPVAAMLHPAGKFDAHGPAKGDVEAHYKEGDVNKSFMPVAMCIALLLAVIMIIVITIAFLLDSISGVTDKYPSIGKYWFVIIFVSAASKVAEFSFAIEATDEKALKHRCQVGAASSLQITMFIIPLVDVIAWIFNKPFLMLFDPFPSFMLLVGVLIGNALVLGTLTWLHGALLICHYAMIAVQCWFHPWREGVFECFH